MRSEKGESVIVMKTFCALLVTSILSLSAAIAATEQEIVNESAAILRDFRRMPERGIPAASLREAKGLAIIKVVKVGLGISGKGGEGVVVARTGGGGSVREIDIRRGGVAAQAKAHVLRAALGR